MDNAASAPPNPVDVAKRPVPTSRNHYLAGLVVGYCLGAVIGFDVRVIIGGLALAGIFLALRRWLGTRAAMWLAWLVFILAVSTDGGAVLPQLDSVTFFMIAVTLPGIIAFEFVRAATHSHHPDRHATAPAQGKEAATAFDPWQGRAPPGPSPPGTAVGEK